MKYTLTTLICLSLGAVATAQDTPSPSHSAETYGGASGDVPMPGMGLVLELVDGASETPTLRLFGGPAGQEAVIMLSAALASIPGPRGSERLLQDSPVVMRGAFDWRGYYEVPMLTGTATEFYAQGMHIGLFDLAPGGEPFVQMSNGVHVFPTSVDEEALGFEDLLPHLPEPLGALPITTPLAERLQAYLNSAGDSAKIKLQVEGSLGSGANGGAEVEVEFLVARTDDGLYEVKVAADVAAKAGVEAVEGVEANVAGGVGMTRVFRFQSAPGAARGIFGIMLSLRFPNITPGKWIAESGLLGDAEDMVQGIKATIQFAQQNADEARELLWNVLDVAMANSLAQRNQAYAQMRHAAVQLAACSWHQRLFYLANLGARSAVYHALNAKYVAARIAREQGEMVLNGIEAVIEQHREELRAILAGAARVHHIASALLQLRGYATDHFAGTEYRQKIKGDAKVGIPIPVKLEGLGANASAEAEMVISVLFEGMWGEDSSRITVTRQLETKGTVDGSLVGIVGGKYQRKSTGTVVDAFEYGDGSLSKSMGITLAKDSYVAGSAGMGVSVSAGAGRGTSVSLGQDQFTIDENFDLGAFLTGQDRDLLADTSVGFGLQDRLVRTIECEIKGSIAGNGGGFKLEIEWADQGRKLSRSTTIRDALDTLIDGADQVLDPESGLVLTN